MKKNTDYNIEGKTIKEANQGSRYFWLTFTDGTTLDLDVKGDAYIDYDFREEE